MWTRLLGAALLVCRWWWVLDKLNTFLDVALETFDSSFDELLLVVIGVAKRIGGFLGTRRLKCG